MSLFGRVTRYRPRADYDQRENRLTEVMAGVLEQTDDMALELARSWLRPQPRDAQARDGDHGDPWVGARAALDEDGVALRGVQTQRYTRGGWFVDLELRFGQRLASRAEEVVIWVEAKHGVSPHENQLQNYLTDIAQLGVGAWAVVLLAPRDYYPFVPEPPVDVPQRTWQETARTVADWSAPSEVDGFLRDELAAYLREEGLMDPEAITPLHLTALAERRRAEEAVASACEIASGYIARHWNKRESHCSARTGGPELYGIGYWETYPQAPREASAADWSPAWWDWNLMEDDREVEDSRGGVPVFVSGLCVERGDPYITGTEGAAWEARLADSHGFVSLANGWDRFVRVAYPEEVLIGRTLQQQGERLGAWIVEGYQALYAAGPPPGAGGRPRPE